MPLIIPEGFPAAESLRREGIHVCSRVSLGDANAPALKIAVLNLMPTKAVTELQLLRLLGNTSLTVDVRFLRMASHESKNTSAEHLDDFYETFDSVKHERFDGLVITGAPVETLPFEAVDYWPELVRLMDWSLANVRSTMHICWGAQAGLYHHYGVDKQPLAAKMFGIFHHATLDSTVPVVRGFDEVFLAPHSRHTEVAAEAIALKPGLRLLAVSEAAGVYLAASRDGRNIFVTGHPEYDALTLDAEYRRDVAKGLAIEVPANYYPDDDPRLAPVQLWKAHAHLLYANWLNFCVSPGPGL